MNGHLSTGLNNALIANPTATINGDQTYYLKVINGFACVNRDSVFIKDHRIEKFNLGNDTSFCKNGSYTLKAPIAGPYSWNTGATTSEISVNSSGLYWLRVNNQYCNQADTIAINVFNLPQFKIKGKTIICDEPIELSTNPALNNVQYNWSNGDNGAAVLINAPGKYLLNVKDVNDCEFKDSIAITKGQIPVLSGIKDTIKCMGVDIEFKLANISHQRYIWNDLTQSPNYIIKGPGQYSVKASTECRDTTAYFNITEQDCRCTVWIPNAFSPNNDAHNNVFKIESVCPIYDFELKIYSSWGELVYETNDPMFNWDGTYKGKILPLGVYMYMVKYRKDLRYVRIFEQFSDLIEIKL
jgi:gliding motility-associated-like protein